MSEEINKDKYLWYSTVRSSESPQQGDFILRCQIFQPKVEAIKNGEKIPVTAKEYDVIILSQSCDLISEKIKLVLVCPFYTLTELGETDSNYKSPAKKNALKNGFVVGMHLLEKCDINNCNDYLVVDFKSTYAVPLEFLKNIISDRGDRIRLMPPYREHLSQAFARFFMRVGLPMDIPNFN